MQDILVVGAGFAGAVHARELAERGCRVHVIDKREHIAGNAYDYVDQNGIRVHRYGPHLFHTKMDRVIDWLRQFGDFEPYTHRVRALLPSGVTVPLPININTINTVFAKNLTDPADVKEFLSSLSVPIQSPRNAAEYLYSRIGRDLTELFFRPYTKKMWQLDLEDMASSVVKRIPIHFNTNDSYFNAEDKQIMPKLGYTNLFANILNHQNIRYDTNVEFEKSMEKSYDFCFNSMPIDEYFEFTDGELPYRSIKFHHRTSRDVDTEQSWATTNFTDAGPFTRETAWHVIPHHVVADTGRRTHTKEEPCDYRDNDFERYYPVKTADDRNQVIYDKYKARAAENSRLSFIGRCGTYQYLDMDQVINQSLTNVSAWIARHLPS
ncbi:FAD-dependent oxidoreductase [Methylobacterium sp. JK268]